MGALDAAKYCCWYACDARCRSSCVGGADPHWGVVAEEEPDACPGPVLLPQRIQSTKEISITSSLAIHTHAKRRTATARTR